MGILSWIIFGLVAGVIAKWLLPGRDPQGCVVTIALGVAGGIVGGYLGTQMGLGTVDAFDIRSLCLAVGGTMLLLYIHRMVMQRKK
ncbi:MAG TPA: GlsB/YeaQ/YmgE family stress response membrane protein [Planctomycetaceae bacterium]|nr:GlsB/YeaQ/YmgE family stress response membrane protein [Planctomycetaceae bacterium]